MKPTPRAFTGICAVITLFAAGVFGLARSPVFERIVLVSSQAECFKSGGKYLGPTTNGMHFCAYPKVFLPPADLQILEKELSVAMAEGKGRVPTRDDMHALRALQRKLAILEGSQILLVFQEIEGRGRWMPAVAVPRASEGDYDPKGRIFTLHSPDLFPQLRR